MRWQNKDKLSEHYQVIKLHNDDNQTCSYWLIRPRWVVNPVIDPMEIKHKKQRQKIFLYQAKVLGNLHRSKANNTKAYLKALNNINVKQWKKATKYIVGQIEMIWQNKDRISM